MKMYLAISLGVTLLYSIVFCILLIAPFFIKRYYYLSSRNFNLILVERLNLLHGKKKVLRLFQTGLTAISLLWLSLAVLFWFPGFFQNLCREVKIVYAVSLVIGAFSSVYVVSIYRLFSNLISGYIILGADDSWTSSGSYVDNT
jgi:hypothetical protein